MAMLVTAAHRHHSEVSSSVLIHVKAAMATTLARPKMTAERSEECVQAHRDARTAAHGLDRHQDTGEERGAVVGVVAD